MTSVKTTRRKHIAILLYKIVNKKGHLTFAEKLIAFIPFVRAEVEYSFLNIILNLQKVVVFLLLELKYGILFHLTSELQLRSPFLIYRLTVSLSSSWCTIVFIAIGVGNFYNSAFL